MLGNLINEEALGEMSPKMRDGVVLILSLAALLKAGSELLDKADAFAKDGGLKEYKDAITEIFGKRVKILDAHTCYEVDVVSEVSAS